MSKLKILALDDDLDASLFLNEILDDNFFDLSFDHTKNFDEFLNRFSENSYDAFILDYNIGGQTSCHLVDIIREEVNVPIVYLTGSDEDGLKQKLLRSGVNKVFFKDQLNVDHLYKALTAI